MDTDNSSGNRKRLSKNESDDKPYKRMRNEDVCHLKLLVASQVAGAVIGKGGDTIAQIQKDANCKVKMSRNNETFPGTTDRICLISGSVDNILAALKLVNSKLAERMFDGKKNGEDFRQDQEKIKILITNSVAGMIIGKGGSYIKQLMEESGSNIQVSQQSRDPSGPQERCVTITGTPDKNVKACSLILNKIKDSNDAVNLTMNYSQHNDAGPPFPNHFNNSPGGLLAPPNRGPPVSPFIPSLHEGRNNAMESSNSSAAPIGLMSNHQASGSGGRPTEAAGLNNVSIKVNLEAGKLPPNLVSQIISSVSNGILALGHSNQIVNEVSTAIFTLSKYGFLEIGLNNNSSNSFEPFGGPSPPQTQDVRRSFDSYSAPLRKTDFGPPSNGQGFTRRAPQRASRPHLNNDAGWRHQ